MKHLIKTILQLSVFFVLLLFAVAVFYFFSCQSLTVSAYTLEADIYQPIRIVHLSDLHNKEFGENNKELVSLVAEQKPDLIFMSGDMLNRDDPNTEIVSNLIEALIPIAPVYFGYGNHEYSWELNYEKDLRQIFTDVKDITAENVVEVLNKALSVHNRNRTEEVYLEKYARGIQPILNRVKQYNDHVCNRTVVNLANEILSFKVAEHAGEPIQYISRGKNTAVPEKIETLNSLLLSEGKQPKDMDLAYQTFLYGVGYRLTLNDKAPAFSRAMEKGDDFDEAPFEIYIPDSRNTFVK